MSLRRWFTTKGLAPFHVCSVPPILPPHSYLPPPPPLPLPSQPPSCPSPPLPKVSKQPTQCDRHRHHWKLNTSKMLLSKFSIWSFFDKYECHQPFFSVSSWPLIDQLPTPRLFSKPPSTFQRAPSPSSPSVVSSVTFAKGLTALSPSYSLSVFLTKEIIHVRKNPQKKW